MNKQHINFDTEVDVFVPDEQQTTWLEKFAKIISLSEFLRVLGACAVLASMSLFLLNGWSEGNDIQRYLKLLAQTGLLTAGGFALSAGLKEYKGARFFFGLSLISVAANFTILGALIYSMVQWDSALQDYPAALTWTTVEAGAFLPLFAGAVAVLTLLSRFSMSIFARRHASLLSTTFLLVCAGLLIPVRDSLGISMVMLVAVLLAYRVNVKVRNSEEFLNTPEANFALMTLFIAPGIILARALSLYHVDEVLMLTLSGLSWLALRSFSLRKSMRCAERVTTMQRFSGIAQFLLALNISFQSVALLPRLPDELALLAVCVLALVFTVEFVFSQRHQRVQRQYLLWSVSVLLILTSTVAVLASGIGFTLVMMLVGMSTFALAKINDERLNTRSAITFSSIVLALSMILLAIDFVKYVELGNWVVIGFIGGALIVGASLYERFGLRLTNV